MSVNIKESLSNYFASCQQADKAIENLHDMHKKQTLSSSDYMALSDAIFREFKATEAKLLSDIDAIYSQSKKEKGALIQNYDEIKLAQREIKNFLELNQANHRIQELFATSVMHLDSLIIELQRESHMAMGDLEKMTLDILNAKFEAFAQEPSYAEAKELLDSVKSASFITSDDLIKKQKSLETFTAHIERLKELKEKLGSSDEAFLSPGDISKAVKDFDKQKSSIEQALEKRPENPRLLEKILFEVRSVEKILQDKIRYIDALDRASRVQRYDLPTSQQWLISSLDLKKFITEASLMVKWAKAIKNSSEGFKEGQLDRKIALDYIAQYLSEELEVRELEAKMDKPLSQERFEFIQKVKAAISSMVPEIEGRLKARPVKTQQMPQEALPKQTSGGQGFFSRVLAGFF